MVVTNKTPDTSAIEKIKTLPDNFDPAANPEPVNPPQDPPVNPSPTQDPTMPPADPNNQPPADPKPEDNQPPVNPPADDPYKVKFAESSREAQILAAKNRKIQETISQAAQLADPTEDELRHEYTDWDNLTDFEKKMARDTFISNRRFSMINQAVVENNKVDEWAKKVDEYVQNPVTLQSHKDLEGRQAEFRSFAMKESRRGLDMEELVKYFLAVQPATPAPANPGSMVQRPNGGNPPKPAQTGYSPEQIALIRKTDHRKYNELVAKGVIKLEV